MRQHKDVRPPNDMYLSVWWMWCREARLIALCMRLGIKRCLWYGWEVFAKSTFVLFLCSAHHSPAIFKDTKGAVHILYIVELRKVDNSENAISVLK